jgi:hypothetical protein
MPSPLVLTLIQSTTLNIISNILAQVIDQYYRRDVRDFISFPTIFSEQLFSCFSSNVGWQNGLYFPLTKSINTETIHPSTSLPIRPLFPSTADTDSLVPRS